MPCHHCNQPLPRDVFDCRRDCGAVLCSRRCEGEHARECRHSNEPEWFTRIMVLLLGLVIAAFLFFGGGLKMFDQIAKDIDRFMRR